MGDRHSMRSIRTGREADGRGPVIITDPERLRILNPGPSKECQARIEELDRMTRRGGW